MTNWLVAVAVLVAGCGNQLSKQPPAPSAATCRCRPSEPCWPVRAKWQELAARLSRPLLEPTSPLETCKDDSSNATCVKALADVKNPFFVSDHPGGTQTSGWFGAWTAAPSVYAVEATSTADVAEAVRFARMHRLRLVIKGTGHDYLGRSTAPDSLLVWTHRMRDVVVHASFTPAGCTNAGVPAVSVGAGTRWLEVYREITPKHGRYVQGGGCTSVGVAGGFTQGGGFGSWSKRYGTGASGVLEIEVVTADGEVRIANPCQNQDLFWALRGGGGGTFGVVTRMTLMTHELPSQFGVVRGTIEATSPVAFQRLLERFVAFYRDALNDEHWGEQIRIARSSIELTLVSQGLTQREVEAVWQPLRAWVEANPADFRIQLQVMTAPSRAMWSYDALKAVPGAITEDPRPDQRGIFWWTSNQEEVSQYWYAYQSRWLPVRQLDHPAQLAQTLFNATRHWPVQIHINKGLAGGSVDAIARTRQTSMNPAVFDAAGLILLAASSSEVNPKVRGRDPDAAKATAMYKRVSAAMQVIRAAMPDAGSYVNETDFFEADWQRSFWGVHYDRLLAIKRAVDPDGLFVCHHCVGSEEWSDDGMCRR